ncbi:hypothetical protein CJEDD_06230 [Corynebacterium jeddahense]|uniref:Secreted protein n=1 Tax=Corynebacterium jeddahense TaxID=1414719 RepID=A0ABY7UME5_9CORY|nr:hypothetical protein CJEDD_06230 [Corynebacterium jeddahense]
MARPAVPAATATSVPAATSATVSAAAVPIAAAVIIPTPAIFVVAAGTALMVPVRSIATGSVFPGRVVSLTTVFRIYHRTLQFVSRPL